jgi:hypothetical protein
MHEVAKPGHVIDNTIHTPQHLQHLPYFVDVQKAAHQAPY